MSAARSNGNLAMAHDGECTGKRAFATPQEALASAEHTRAKVRAQFGYDLKIYRCRTCALWHVGGGVIDRKIVSDRRHETEKRTWKNWHWRNAAAED